MLESEEHGQAMRALCRAIYDSDLIVGGYPHRDTLEHQAKRFVDAGDYGAAGVLLSLLCLMDESARKAEENPPGPTPPDTGTA